MNLHYIKQIAKTYGCYVEAKQDKLIIFTYSKSCELTQQQANGFDARQFQAVCEEVSGRRIAQHWTGGDVA